VRGTKILATVGPASDSPGGLRRLVAAGATGIRLNFSHGTDDEHRATLERVHDLPLSRENGLAIVADLQGPKIRIGDLLAGQLVLVDGAEVTMDTDPRPGDLHRIPVTLRQLTEAVRPGDPLLLGDGSVSLVVQSVEAHRVLTRVQHGGPVSPHAGLYLPRASLRAEILGAKDRHDLELALEAGVDDIAVSFVRDGTDLRTVRRAIRRHDPESRVGIIAKIERAEALRHLDSILAEADGLMVARGDLGIEVPLERLALEQKSLVLRANRAGRLVIVATQMLLSMVTSPRPTRAEATDVANAVLDGADCLMLSEESAIGRYPSESVAWLARIAAATEPAIDREHFAGPGDAPSSEEFIAGSAVRLAEQNGASALAVPTHSGRTARLVARHRPSAAVWAFSTSPAVRRQLALLYGVRAFPSAPHRSLAGMRESAVRTARAEGIRSGSVVLTAGFPVEGRPTNLVTLVELGNGRRPRPRRSGSAAAPPARAAAASRARSRRP
jgi:pyruvate kinase